MDTIDVKSLLLEAERLAAGIAKPADRAETLATIAHNAAIVAEWEIAQRISLATERLLLNRRTNSRARAFSMTRLAQAHFLAGDEEIARAMLAKAIAYVKHVRDGFRSQLCLYDCAKAAIALGDFDQALDLALRINDPSRSFLLEKLGVALAANGDTLGAKRVVMLLKDVEAKSAALRDAATRLIRLGADADAIDMIELIPDDIWKAFAYSQIAITMRDRARLQSNE